MEAVLGAGDGKVVWWGRNVRILYNTHFLYPTTIFLIFCYKGYTSTAGGAHRFGMGGFA